MLKKIANLTAACVLIASSALADTVILKSGEKVEGKIISNTDAGVTVEVKLTGGITDERVIKKADVAEVKAAQPEEEAWGPLKGISLGDDSLEAEGYDRSIELLKGYVSQFPKSANVAEAQKRIAALEEEKKRVGDGELKVGGKWLTKEQVEEDRVQIKGRQLLAVMKRQVASGQHVDAMNTYSALEKAADGSVSYPEAVLLARKILPSLRAAAEARRTQIKAQLDENKRRLANLKGAEKQQLETIQKQQAAQIESYVRAEEARGLKWLSLSPSNDRSIGVLISKASSEIANVNRVDPDKMRSSISSAEKAKAALAANDFPTAEKALNDANSAWATNEMSKRVQQKLVEARLKAAQAAEKAARLAAQPPPPPVAPKATSTPATAEPTAPEEPPKEDDSSAFSKPAFWIILIIVLGGAAFALKFLRKLKDRAKDVIDQ